MPPRAKAAEAPGRSPQVEKYLTDREFSWEFRTDVPLEAFDEEKSLHNQARVGKPIDPGTVARYVAALENGDVFPGVVAADMGRRRPLLIADGNHRFQAHKENGRKTIDAYVVLGASPAAVTMLTFEANTKHGLPTSEADRIHQALYLMDNNVSAEDAARRLGLKVSALRTQAALAQADRRAEDHGIPAQKWERLPQSVKQRLNQISTDEGFEEMAKLTVDAGLRTEDIAKAVNDINSLRSSRKQQDYVRALRTTHAESIQTGGVNLNHRPMGRQQRSGRVAYSMALGQITALPSPDSIVERMTDEDRPEWIRRTTEAIGRLNAILDTLKK